MAAQIAHHYDSAGEAEQALEQYRRAATAARRLCANEAAIVYLRRAIALAQQVAVTTAVEIELHESLGDTLRLTGQYEEARSAYETTQARLAEDDNLCRAELHRKTGTTYDRQSRHPQAAAAYEAALAALGAAPTTADVDWWQAWLKIELNQLDSLYFSGDVKGMHELVNRLQPVVDEIGTAVQQYKLMGALSQLRNRQQRFRLTEADVRGARERLAVATTMGDPWNIEQSRFSLGFHLLWSDAPEHAIPHLIEALERSEATGDLKLQNQCTAYLAIAYRLQGQVALVREYSERGLNLAQRLSYPPYIAVAQANFAWIHYRAEQWSQAEAKARAALALWTPQYPLHWLAWWILLAGHLRRDELHDAVVAAAAMLAPEQQRLPDDVTAALEQAILAYENSEVNSSRHHFSTALDTAYTCGHL
jgi:tetratricopeptide (TPR) repeat protein